MQFRSCYGVGPFNTFHHCCCYWTEKWICTKIARRKFDAKECKLRSKCHICIPISTRGPVDRYRNLAFITFAQIYSLVCTFLLHICGEQIWCKSIFSSANRKKRRKRIWTQSLLFFMFLRLLAKICPLIIRNELQVSKTSLLLLTLRLPATKEIGDVCTHAEKGRLRNSVANRVPASCLVPKILGTRCDRLIHSAHCLT